MPDDDLTREQRRAVEAIDRDVLVTAGAGTGKTRVLTHHFSYLVEVGAAAPDEILALTFTEKAAREMKQRVVARFEGLGRSEDRRLVETAYIGTIHSFCARVLRENALEAAVDPRFNVLPEAQAAMLARRVFDEIVGRGYSAGGPVVALLGELEYKDLREMLLSAYGRVRSLGKAAPELVIAAPPDIEAHAAAASEAAREALDLATEPTTAASARMLEEFAARAERLRELLAVREFDWGAYSDLGDIARVLRRGVGAKHQQPVVAGAKDALEAFAKALAAAHAAEQEAALSALMEEFDREYSAAKDELGCLDFNDLLGKARDLFGAAHAPTPTALAYRRRFKFFLMDEFQDTNRLQMAVVEPLLRPNASFTVGDARQSIYRFLYADVGVFLERERELRARGGATHPLSQNFRSHPQVLQFINGLFGALAAEGDFPFAPLEAGKRFGPREGPRVEVLLVAEQGAKGDARTREAEALARRICEVVGMGDGPRLLLTEEGRQRPARLGDILILFRATSDVALYEDALSDYDLPYYTVSGRGFFNTREVQDLRNLLAAIANPLEDVALAAVLRSPLVGVGDETLYWLGAPTAPAAPAEDEAPRQGQGRIAERLAALESLPHISAGDRERLTRFRRLLRGLREEAAGSRVADILDRAIRDTDYDIKLLAQRNGRRRYANVEKLRQVALDFQAEQRFELRDFIEHLETLQVLADRETEAPTEAEESDVVRLMTIHQAKGLEAPVVVVADTGRAHSFPQPPAIVSDHGELALRLKNPLASDSVKPEAYQRLEGDAEAADAAEDQRIFYVACTRAQEHLLISGCIECDDAGGIKSLPESYAHCHTWAQAVARFLDIAELPPAQGTVAERDGLEVLLRSDTPAPPARAPSRRPLLARMRARLEAGAALDIEDLGGDAEILAAQARQVAERLEAVAPPKPRLPGVSVTSALTYAECPRRYSYADIERLPDAPGDEASWSPPGDEAEDEDPADRGERLHNLLARIDFRADLEAELARLAADLPPAARGDAGEVLRRFAQGPLWARLRAAQAEPGALLRETPFVAPLEGGWLRGTMDVLLREGDEWLIIDYKTGARREQEHRAQALLYALACRRLLGRAPRQGMIHYLDEHGGPPLLLTITDADLADIAAQAAAVVAGIAAGDFEPRPGGACGWCPYAATCRENSTAPSGSPGGSGI